MKPPSFIVSILEQKNNERNPEQMREIDALRDFHRKDKKEYRVFIESQNLWRFDGILEIITIFVIKSNSSRSPAEVSPLQRVISPLKRIVN